MRAAASVIPRCLAVGRLRPRGDACVDGGHLGKHHGAGIVAIEFADDLSAGGQHRCRSARADNGLLGSVGWPTSNHALNGPVPSCHERPGPPPRSDATRTLAATSDRYGEKKSLHGDPLPSSHRRSSDNPRAHLARIENPPGRVVNIEADLPDLPGLHRLATQTLPCTIVGNTVALTRQRSHATTKKKTEMSLHSPYAVQPTVGRGHRTPR